MRERRIGFDVGGAHANARSGFARELPSPHRCDRGLRTPEMVAGPHSRRQGHRSYQLTSSTIRQSTRAGSARPHPLRIFEPEKTLVPLRTGRNLEPHAMPWLWLWCRYVNCRDGGEEAYAALQQPWQGGQGTEPYKQNTQPQVSRLTDCI